LFHVISKIIWAFNIEKASDASTGKPYKYDTTMETGYREGLTACAYDFPIKLTVRSEARKQAILREFEQAKVDIFSKYEKGGFFS
jgi:cytochrome P450 family 619